MNYLCNDILIQDNYAVLVCKSKTFGTFESLIDIEDIPKIQKLHWNIRYDKRHPKHYIESRSTGRRIHLHRYLMGLEDFNLSNTVDHINGNTLDNRKINLKICSHKENMQNVALSRRNKAGMKFITWCNTNKRWKIVYKGKYLKSFKNIDEAKEFLTEYLKTA